MSASLAERLESTLPTETVPVIVTLREQVDADRYEGRPGALLLALKRVSTRSRDALDNAIDGPSRRFWLVNAHSLRATADEITALGDDRDVERIDLDPRVRAHDARQAAIPDPTPGSGNWGLEAAGIPGARAASGTSGSGVVVGSIDTGVEATHPQLAGRIVAFRDFVNSQGEAYDDNGHGTHTLGTMIGGDAGGIVIGAAPNATAVVAKAMNSQGVGSGSDLLAAAQWITDPDGDPSTHDQPDVVNNSWAASGANDTWFRSMIRRWTDLGIVPVFAVGNTGPAASSIGSPASYPESIAVGAMSQAGEVATFSARGPVVWTNGDQLGPAEGTPLTKPDLVAPGSGITSTGPGGFLTFTGTSMSSPHVAGVVALMREKSPGLSPAAIASILRATARDIDAPGPDPAAGAGSLNAVGALGALSEPAPDTTIVHSPPASTRARQVTFGVAASGATMARYRVDAGPWGAAVALPVVRVPIGAEGDHDIEIQAIGDNGSLDPSPALRTVTVDRTRPRVRIGWRRKGDRATFVARAEDALSPVTRSRWTFGRGIRGAGRRVAVRFIEPGRRSVTVTVRDAAGNRARATRRFLPKVTTPVRRFQVRTSGASVRVSGRLTRPAGLQAVLKPITAVARRASTLSPRSLPTGRAARRARARKTSGGFVLRLPTKRLAPGRYRVELTTREQSRKNSGPLVRIITVRG